MSSNNDKPQPSQLKAIIGGRDHAISPTNDVPPPPPMETNANDKNKLHICLQPNTEMLPRPSWAWGPIDQHTTPQRITATPRGKPDLTTHRPDEVKNHISLLTNTVCCRGAPICEGSNRSATTPQRIMATPQGKLDLTTHRPDKVEYHTMSPTNDEPILPLRETVTLDDPQQTQDYAVSETNDKPIPLPLRRFDAAEQPLSTEEVMKCMPEGKNATECQPV